MHPIDEQAPTDRGASAIVGGPQDHEVIDVVCGFGRGLDLQDTELMASALTADAVLDFRPAAARWGMYCPLMVGGHTIVDLLLGVFAGRVQTTHLLLDPSVQRNHGTARLTAIVQARYLAEADPDRPVLITECCTADLVRDAARWTVRYLHLDATGYIGDPAAIFRR